MGNRLRIPATAVVALVITMGLSSCSIPDYYLVRLGPDDELGIGLCRTETVSAVLIQLGRWKNQEVMQSAILSGPPAPVGDESAIDTGALPAGWQQSEQLDLDTDWEFADVTLVNHGVYVSGTTIHREDLTEGAWSIYPAPSIFGGPRQCSTPVGPAISREDASAHELSDVRVEATRALAMPEDQFWSLIGAQSPNSFPSSISDLGDKLRALPLDQIVGFEAQLQLQLFELDRADLFLRSEQQRWADRDWDTDAVPRFLDTRLLVVIGGERTTRAVLAGGELPSVSQRFGIEKLLFAAQTAVRWGGGNWDVTAVPLSPDIEVNFEAW